jgi:hypothetical protein
MVLTLLDHGSMQYLITSLRRLIRSRATQKTIDLEDPPRA